MFITSSGGTANHAAPRYLWYTTRPIVNINVKERATSTPRALFNQPDPAGPAAAPRQGLTMALPGL